MKTPKYKITANMLQSKGNIRQLESDGFSREVIMKSLHKETRGANTQQKRDIVQKLFNRGEC